MIELPDTATFAAILADRRFLIALAIATASGMGITFIAVRIIFDICTDRMPPEMPP